MNILITPDKFKGSLTALQVCNAIEEGILAYNSQTRVKKIPLADGGEGSLTAFENTIHFRKIFCKVNDPLFRRIEAYYGLKDSTAFIETSLASGLQLLSKSECNPMLTSSFGTGELIRDAIEKGIKNILLFIGGSATNDAGMGIASALGYKFYDENGCQLEPIGKNLSRLKKIDNTNAININELEITVLTDVLNPLYGKKGAAYFYAAQKGANDFEIRELDKGLKNFAKVVLHSIGKDVSLIKGGGAAGGIGAGMHAFCNAQIKSGIENILEMLNIHSFIKESDLVITGEGLFDKQTLEGKVVKGVLDRCRKLDKPAAIICGNTTLSKEEIKKGYQKYFKIIKTNDITIDDSMKNAYKYLVERSKELMEEFTGEVI